MKGRQKASMPSCTQFCSRPAKSAGSGAGCVTLPPSSRGSGPAGAALAMPPAGRGAKAAGAVPTPPPPIKGPVSVPRLPPNIDSGAAVNNPPAPGVPGRRRKVPLHASSDSGASMPGFGPGMSRVPCGVCACRSHILRLCRMAYQCPPHCKSILPNLESSEYSSTLERTKPVTVSPHP